MKGTMFIENTLKRPNNVSALRASLRGRMLVRALLLCMLMAGATSAKTRWSSLHLVPDADFLSGGQYVIDAEGYYFGDSAKGAVIRPTGLATIGIIEWVNMEAGYAGGPTLGFKARLLGETGGPMPSLAIGARNIIKNKEANYFNSKDTTMGNEFYCALAKSVDALRMRIHLGIQTIPTSKKDQADPFFAIEEYFGNGLYATAEVERLKGAFWPSLFVSWRILKKKLEISGGAVAVNRLFFDKNNKFNVSLTSTDSVGFVKPGLWFSVRYCGSFGFSKNNLFMSVDDKVALQREAIDKLSKELDSLKTTMSETQTRMSKVDNSILTLSDSVYSDKNRFRAALYDKLIAMKTMYESEPFDPEQVRQLIRRITALRDNAIPALKEFIIDKKQDRRVRVLSIMLLGEMGGTGASDVLLDVLSQSEDPEIKIEILIALGKQKETRAIYVMEQLANDPVDVVAFTAQEVLMKLVREKGIRLSADFKMRSVQMPESSVIKEEKIPVQKSKPVADVKARDTMAGATAPIAKTAPVDTSKPRPQTAKAGSDDVWGVQGTDSAQAAGKGNQAKSAIQDTLSVPRPGPADSTGIKRDSVSASKDTQGKKADTSPGKKKDKAPKKAKALKKKTEPPDDKNW